ncbi:MAG: hypothetical protein LBG60_15725 [Bifidobacteriaceae bacterium]|jgi:hypothetical protein|nr:hypothetical protein [Bifidobacteriaceae bacterium]
MFDAYAEFLASERAAAPRIQRLSEVFRSLTQEHTLTVARDDGVYRHLVMAEPGTKSRSWEVVTWPWALCVRGDMVQDLVFNHLHDMLDFFIARDDLLEDFERWVEKAPQVWSRPFYDRCQFLRDVGERLQNKVDAGMLDETRANHLFNQAAFAGNRAEDAAEWLSRHTMLGQIPLARERLSDGLVMTCLAIRETIRVYQEME